MMFLRLSAVAYTRGSASFPGTVRIRVPAVFSRRTIRPNPGRGFRSRPKIRHAPATLFVSIARRDPGFPFVRRSWIGFPFSLRPGCLDRFRGASRADSGLVRAEGRFLPIAAGDRLRGVRFVNFV